MDIRFVICRRHADIATEDQSEWSHECYADNDYWTCPQCMETMALARRAVQACDDRKGENVQALAERLANDVKGAND